MTIRRSQVVRRWLGLLLISVSALDLLGTGLGWEDLTTWGVGKPMALPAAACFFLIGCALIVVSMEKREP